MTLSDQARALARGETTSRALVEASLEAIARDPRPFTDVFADEARAARGSRPIANARPATAPPRSRACRFR